MRIGVTKPKKVSTCKGLIFRAYQNYFHSDGRFEEKRGFRLLKRKSCSGCEFCGGRYDHIKEVLADYDSLPVDEIDVFKEYTVTINGHDGEDIEFVPLD